MKGYLLDTNVVSDLRKGERGNAGLSDWFRQRDKREIFLSIVTLAEIRRGVTLLRRRDPVQAAVLDRWSETLEHDFGRVGHLLPLSATEALAWGELMALRPLPILDAFLAATARTHRLTLVTRNEADFAGLPVELENPFS